MSRHVGNRNIEVLLCTLEFPTSYFKKKIDVENINLIVDLKIQVVEIS
jgi:hypothetical protein